MVDRLIKFQAEDQGLEVAQMKGHAIAGIENAIAVEEDEFTKGVLTEIKNFVNSPEEISISIRPSKPLPFGRIMRIETPKDLITALNLKIES